MLYTHKGETVLTIKINPITLLQTAQHHQLIEGTKLPGTREEDADH